MGCLEFFAFLALSLALLADDLDLALGAVDDLIGQPAVHLDLFFAHASRSAAARAAAGAGGLAVKVAPHPGKAGEGILHPGKLDLEAGFAGVGAFRKNIENDLLAVDHTEVGEFFPLALLGRGETVIDDDHIALMGAGQLDHLVRLASAAEEFPMLLAAAAKHHLDHLDTEGFDEFRQFREEGFGLHGLANIKVKAHQQGALDHIWLLSDFEHPPQT